MGKKTPAEVLKQRENGGHGDGDAWNIQKNL